MRVFLLGMMGTGKTTIGKQLSHLLPSFSFLDLDEEIVKKHQLPIAELFAQKGEEFFRLIESQTLEQIIKQQDNFIMATGGGTPMSAGNFELMYKNGLTIYLKTPVKILAQRLWPIRHTRPLIAHAESENQLEVILHDLLKQREPIYLQAHIVWDTSRPIETLADKLKIFVGQCNKN